MRHNALVAFDAVGVEISGADKVRVSEGAVPERKGGDGARGGGGGRG